MSPVILFVEDEKLIVELMEQAWTDAGFTAEHVATGSAAVARLDADHQRFAAVVTDIGLRGKLTGWDVARHARALNPEIPIVYTTGGHADEWPVQGVPKSILVEKPYAPIQVVTAIANLLNASASPI